MTGFASLTQELPQGSLSLELRSVNHRSLETQVRLTDELRAFEPLVRARVADRVRRGKVECRLQFTAGPGQSLPEHLAPALVSRLAALDAQVRAVMPWAAGLSVADVLHWPGVVAGAAPDEAAMAEILTGLLDRGLDQFDAARAREGERLAGFFRERLAEVSAALDAVSAEIPAAQAAFEERLASQLRAALAEADTERLRQEFVLYAQKIDVTEELTRLSAHAAEFKRVLGAPEPAGKRMDFLLQEMNREANTLGAKAPSLAVSQAAIGLKVLIEQMREQALNIE